MTKLDPKLYVDREQTYVKHYFLESYLEKLAYVVGPSFGTITYVDAFAGPWQTKGRALEDSSPRIAMRVLLSVRDGLRARGMLGIRAMFIAADAGGCSTLERTLGVPSDVELLVRHGEFERLIPEVAAFGGKGAHGFCFTFIDPCGWTGMGLAQIVPILAMKPGEVLINFMTGHILRFIRRPDPKTAKSFESLYGSNDFRESWKDLPDEAIEEAAVREYCKRVSKAGSFKHVVSAVVLNPLKNRSYFHLVYATRSDQGLLEFRKIELKALEEQSEVRALARQRKRESRGQRELFGPEVMDTPFISELREKYLEQAANAIALATPVRTHVGYDQVAVAAMQVPTVTEQDAKNILKALRKDGAIEFVDRKPREVPHWNEGHFVLRTKEAK